MSAQLFTLQEAVQHFQQFMTNASIANKLCVSKGQVMKYASGKTISCNDSVLDKFYDHFTFDGRVILIAYFPSEAIYIETRSIRDEAFKARVASDMSGD